MTIYKIPKIKHLLVGLALLLTSVFVVAPQASAAPIGQMAASACSSNFLGFPAWYEHLPIDNQCRVQITELNHIWVIVLNVIDMLVRAAGLVALVYIVWSGYRYMRSQGDPSVVGEAKSTLTNAIIGLVVVILAVGIIEFVARSIT